MSHYLVAKVKSSEILDWENVNLSCIELDCNSSVLITRLKKYVKFCCCRKGVGGRVLYSRDKSLQLQIWSHLVNIQ